jgi:hypothetical protein
VPAQFRLGRIDERRHVEHVDVADDSDVDVAFAGVVAGGDRPEYKRIREAEGSPGSGLAFCLRRGKRHDPVQPAVCVRRGRLRSLRW